MKYHDTVNKSKNYYRDGLIYGLRPSTGRRRFIYEKKIRGKNNNFATYISMESSVSFDLIIDADKSFLLR